MRKLIDALAVASFLVSATVVAAGVTIYVKKDAIIDHVKAQAMEQVQGLIGDAVGGALGGALPIGDDLPIGGDSIPTPPVPLPVPSNLF